MSYPQNFRLLSPWDPPHYPQHDPPPPVSLVGFRRAIARGNLAPALRI